MRFQRIMLAGGGLALGISLVVWWKLPSVLHAQKMVRQEQPIQSTPSLMASSKSIIPENLLMRESRPQGTVQVYQASPSDRLAYLLGETGDGRYSTREAALKLLDPHLSSETITRLLDFLREVSPLVGMNALEQAALKNDVMNVLRNQQVPPAGLTQTLLDIYADSNQPEVMRDYSLQHVAKWYLNGASDSDKPLIVEALKQGTQQNHGSIPGTSLLALTQMSDGNPKQQHELQQIALQLTQSPSSNPLTVTTALQICARLQVKEAYPTALQIAQSSSMADSVRISAIAALGDLGDAQSKVLLQGWVQGNDFRLRVPAAAALKRLTARLSL